MNSVFWGAMMLMLLLAIGIIVWPLLKQRKTVSLAYKDSNLGLYEDKLHELETDLAEGRIEQGFYNKAREELDFELLADIPEENRDSAAMSYGATSKRKPALALFVAAFLPTLALLIYMQLGMHAEPEVAQQQAAAQKEPSVAEMVVLLEQRIEQQGGDAKAWTMLGRAYKHLKRYDDAATAYATAMEKLPDNAQLMLERAEALALANNQTFTKESYDLISRALELQPDNGNALWFAGVAEYQLGNYWQSVDHLSVLVDASAGDELISQSIAFYLNQSRIKLLEAGEDVQPVEDLLRQVGKNLNARKTAQQSVQESARKPVQEPGPDNVVTASSVTVKVDVSDEIRQKQAADTAVFVYAKAQQGPKMPLAVQRMTLADLPATVTLDDSMAMVDGMNISTFGKIIVSARISQAGTAVTRSGDYVGMKKVDDVTTSPTVTILIDTLVP